MSVRVPESIENDEDDAVSGGFGPTRSVVNGREARRVWHVGAVTLIRKLGSGEEKTGGEEENGDEVEQQRRPHRPYVTPFPTLLHRSFRRQRRRFRLPHCSDVVMRASTSPKSLQLKPTFRLLLQCSSVTSSNLLLLTSKLFQNRF